MPDKPKIHIEELKPAEEVKKPIAPPPIIVKPSVNQTRSLLKIADVTPGFPKPGIGSTFMNPIKRDTEEKKETSNLLP